MRIKVSRQEDDGSCGDGKYRVQVFSRRVALLTEFCLDKQENKVTDMEAAKSLLRDTLTPCDFVAASVTLTADAGTNEQTVVRFDLSGE